VLRSGDRAGGAKEGQRDRWVRHAHRISEAAR